MKPIVVFDLDGTLAETAPDLVGTLNVLLAREGLPPLPFAQARDLIGEGARALIMRGFEHWGQSCTQERLEELFEDFLIHYGQNLTAHSHLFPGVVEALQSLARQGYCLAICTNKVEAHSLALMESFGIAPLFSAICGRDTFAFHKPDPRHLLETIRQAGGDPRRAIMVGDSKTDIDTARQVRIPVIGVPFGYTKIPMVDLNPDRLMTHFDQCVSLIEELVSI